MYIYNCMEKKRGGNYTRKLRAILSKSWKQHNTKQQLYEHLPTISITKYDKTFRTLLVERGRTHKVTFFYGLPTYRRASAGRPARTYFTSVMCEHRL